MGSRSLKIFVASCLGAGIGSVLALWVNQSFWWIGALAGAAVGYLFYNIQEVVQTTKVVCRKTIEWRPPGKEYWKAALKLHTWCWLLFFSVLTSNLMIVVAIDFVFYDSVYLLDIGLDLISYMIPSILVLLYALTFPIFDIFDAFLEGGERELNSNVAGAKFLFSRSHPLVVSWHSFIGLSWMLGWVFILLFQALLAIATVIKKVFIAVYSDERLLCAVSAFLGTVVGYLYANPFLGMLAGGVFGVVSYKTIPKVVPGLNPAR